MTTIDQARRAEGLIRDYYRVREMDVELKKRLVTDSITLRFIVRRFGDEPDKTLDLSVPAGIARQYLAECHARNRRPTERRTRHP